MERTKTVYYPINNQELDSYEPGFQFEDYKATNPLSAVVYLEINYDLAHLTRSECKRTALRFFLIDSSAFRLFPVYIHLLKIHIS